MQHNYVLRIAYDGSDYYGWQKTMMGPSIESILQSTLEKIVQHPITLQAASRTDRGVHAEDQYVNFFSEKHLNAAALLKSLNALLPSTIRVLHLQEMGSQFHPTLDAVSKEYHYFITFGSVQMPAKRAYYWHVPNVLNIEKMAAASIHFLGTHDFSAFCNMRKNLNYPDKIRTIESISILTPLENEVHIVVKGPQFLYKMVRNIVGTLVYVGMGKIDVEEIPRILQTHHRPEAGITAPAHGLTLKKINYPQEKPL